jgi:hypothetical protein
MPDKRDSPFGKHRDECRQCEFFPLSPACYEGAKILNPSLDKTEQEYRDSQWQWEHKFMTKEERQK